MRGGVIDRRSGWLLGFGPNWPVHLIVVVTGRATVVGVANQDCLAFVAVSSCWSCRFNWLGFVGLYLKDVFAPRSKAY